MKKILVTVIGLIMIATVVTLASPSLRDERHWKSAVHRDTVESYAGYLHTWPEGKHVTEAKGLYEERGWQDASAANTIQGFQTYLRNHPEGKYITRARERIEDLRWKDAAVSNTIPAFQTYLRDYPAGKYHAQASERIENLRWQAATTTNTIHAFQSYLQDYLAGKYVAQAGERIEDLEWKNAMMANTIASYQRYLSMYPSGRFLKEAKEKIAALAKDDAPFLAVEKQGIRKAYETFLVEFPGHKREADARSALKDMVEGQDIVDLLAQKKIEVTTQGSGITSVSLEIRRRVNHDVTVRIPVGTFFVARQTSAQNMVTTHEQTVVLTNDHWTSVSVSAACANRPRNIPGNDDSFTIQHSPHQKELEKLMPVLQKAGVGSDVAQAAVWIVTDNADYDNLGTLVRRSQFQIFGGTRVIQESEATRAMEILDEAGIDIKKKAIWGDYKTILKGLTDENLKAWIRRKAGH